MGILHLSTNSVSVSMALTRHSTPIMVIARRSSCCLTSLIRPNAVSLQLHRFFSEAFFYTHSVFSPSPLLVVCRSALKVVSSRLSDVAHEQCCATLCHADQLWIAQMGSFGMAPTTRLLKKALNLFNPPPSSHSS